MTANQRDHQTAINWIEGEIENLIKNLGQRNASAAATSCITLAFMLRVIDDAEHRRYRAQIDEIYDSYNAKLTHGAAA